MRTGVNPNYTSLSTALTWCLLDVGMPSLGYEVYQFYPLLKFVHSYFLIHKPYPVPLMKDQKMSQFLSSALLDDVPWLSQEPKQTFQHQCRVVHCLENG